VCAGIEAVAEHPNKHNTNNPTTSPIKEGIAHKREKGALKPWGAHGKACRYALSLAKIGGGNLSCVSSVRFAVFVLFVPEDGAE
jgi:hypothetical protein